MKSNVLIFDGSSNHLTQSVLNSIERATNDKYRKVPGYAHHLSPVERGFANVWRLTRQLYALEPKKPREKVRQAFEYYMYSGAGGAAALGHFALYERNHNYWLSQPG